MPRLSGALDIVQVNDPATPQSGRQFLYFKADGSIYTKRPDGSVASVISSDTAQTIGGAKTFTSTVDAVRVNKTASGASLQLVNKATKAPLLVHSPTGGGGGTSVVVIRLPTNMPADLSYAYVIRGFGLGTVAYEFHGSGYSSSLSTASQNAVRLSIGRNLVTALTPRLKVGYDATLNQKILYLTDVPTYLGVELSEFQVNYSGIASPPDLDWSTATIDLSSTLPAAVTFVKNLDPLAEPLGVVPAAGSVSGSFTLPVTKQLFGRYAGRTALLTNTTAATITVPPDDATDPIDIGAFTEVSQGSTGIVTIAGGSGVTIRSATGLYTTSGQYSTLRLRKRAANEWELFGEASSVYVRTDTAQTVDGAKTFSSTVTASSGVNVGSAANIFGNATPASSTTPTVSTTAALLLRTTYWNGAASVSEDGSFTAGRGSTDPADSWYGTPRMLRGSALVATGLTGATSTGRYVGVTVSGAPTTGTFRVGDWINTQDGHFFVCTVAGTPGTWVDVASSVSAPAGGSTASVVTITATTTAVANTIYLANGTFTVTVPITANFQTTIKNIGTGAITVVPASGTIDGDANYILSSRYSSLSVVADGTNAFVI